MSGTVLFLVGPTGSGKSELALLLAKRLGCEIISGDSMQIYRGMNIGTAKPSLRERRRVPHHLVNIASPRAAFSVYEYRKRALRAIREILNRGRIPLVVGGSGLYLEALWKGLSDPLGSDPRLRRRLHLEAKKKGLPVLYERLKAKDPARAGRIHPHDERRIIRALEIVELSGKPLSESFGKRQSLEDLGFAVRTFGIQRDRLDLYERINQRVIHMFKKCFLKEVARLRRKGFSKTARQALGYKEVLAVIARHRTLGGFENDLISLIQKKTRQFAKRQLTWFRREKEIAPFGGQSPASPLPVPARVAGGRQTGAGRRSSERNMRDGIEWIFWGKGESVQEVCGKIMRRVHHA